mmetsp:Transcript_108264/g.248275  ORF Transcript_108264/g.248275 Transcript_108264/m.248275 type:complete len:276 (+) Transcript_108264:1404-2231(+)
MLTWVCNAAHMYPLCATVGATAPMYWTSRKKHKMSAAAFSLNDSSCGGCGALYSTHIIPFCDSMHRKRSRSLGASDPSSKLWLAHSQANKRAAVASDKGSTWGSVVTHHCLHRCRGAMSGCCAISWSTTPITSSAFVKYPLDSGSAAGTTNSNSTPKPRHGPDGWLIFLHGADSSTLVGMLLAMASKSDLRTWASSSGFITWRCLDPSGHLRATTHSSPGPPGSDNLRSSPTRPFDLAISSPCTRAASSNQSCDSQSPHTTLTSEISLCRHSSIG